MQRVVSINLNGGVYPLEENGYTALFAYLDALETRLKNAPDRAHRIADTERLVAEKCQACLEPHKAVITTADIARILSEMDPLPDPTPNEAPPAEAAASNTDSASNGGPAASEPPRAAAPPHKRLCQIREGGMIGGVCLGIATFFNIDVTLVRVVFALFAFVTGGWGVLAYLGLMFILPRATSIAEAAAPAPAGVHQWPWDDGWPWETHGWPWDRPHARAGHDQRREWRAAAEGAAAAMARRAKDRAHGVRTAALASRYADHHLLRDDRVRLAGVLDARRIVLGLAGVLGRSVFLGRASLGRDRALRCLLPLPDDPVPLVTLGVLYGHSGYGPYHGYGPWSALWHAFAWVATLLFLLWLASLFVPGLYEVINQIQWGAPTGRFDV